jgi:hypothetical protein
MDRVYLGALAVKLKVAGDSEEDWCMKRAPTIQTCSMIHTQELNKLAQSTSKFWNALVRRVLITQMFGPSENSWSGCQCKPFFLQHMQISASPYHLTK